MLERLSVSLLDMSSELPKKDQLAIRTVQIITLILATLFALLKYTEVVTFTAPDYVIVGLYFIGFGLDPALLANINPWSKK